MGSHIHHGRVEVERRFPQPASRIFRAFADASEREKWGAPSDTAAFVVERDEFREGGCDLTRCGDAADPQILVETKYHHIVKDNSIIATETIRNDGKLVAVTLKTVAFLTEGSDCLCRVTVQVASMVGDEMIGNTQHGQNGSMDHLMEFLHAGDG